MLETLLGHQFLHHFDIKSCVSSAAANAAYVAHYAEHYAKYSPKHNSLYVSHHALCAANDAWHAYEVVNYNNGDNINNTRKQQHKYYKELLNYDKIAEKSLIG